MEKNTQGTDVSLADIFTAWMGEKAKETKDIRVFLQETHLSEFISINDIDRIINYGAYFPDEAVLAVYSLMPPVLKIKNKEYAVFPQTFRRLNKRTEQQSQGPCLNVNFKKAGEICAKYYPEKKEYIEKNKNHLRYLNQKNNNPEALKMSRERYLNSLSEEKKQERMEKSRQRAKRYYESNKEDCKKRHQQYLKQRTPMKKDMDRIEARIRYRKYRELHPDEPTKGKKRREHLKQENPQLLKELDSRYNRSESHRKSSQEYYLRHKEEIAKRAKENPKSKLYRQKYKAKKRFQEKTGTIIMSLLQALRMHKSQRD